jgi:hypothetical protein
MHVLPPVEEEIRRVVRDERAKDPLISVARLEAALEKHFNRGFSHNYVSKIADKVARKGLIESDLRRQLRSHLLNSHLGSKGCPIPSSGQSLQPEAIALDPVHDLREPIRASLRRRARFRRPPSDRLAGQSGGQRAAAAYPYDPYAPYALWHSRVRIEGSSEERMWAAVWAAGGVGHRDHGGHRRGLRAYRPLSPSGGDWP